MKRTRRGAASEWSETARGDASRDAKHRIMDAFDAYGECPTLGDPYRGGSEISKLMFSDDGNLTSAGKAALEAIVAQRPVRPMCTAVRILVAEEFAGSTGGNYSTIYLWR